MNQDQLNNLEKKKLQEKGQINLAALSFEFCDESTIHTFYAEKLRLLENKEKWIEANKDRLAQNKNRIVQAVKDGLIKDSRPETIWQFKINEASNRNEIVPKIKKTLEGRIDEIKDEIIKRLSKFLPDWEADEARIIFTINEQNDFSIDNNIITVDLGRLASAQDLIEKAKAGITHEIFHHWMAEKLAWSDSKQDAMSDRSLKNQIIFKTIDEGLAVLISNQSLEKYHTDQGQNFTKYTKLSFDSFNHFLRENTRKQLEKYKEEEFKDMVHFYVVGNKIVTTILESYGLETFRKQIIEARNNPSMFLERYKELCKKDSSLPKIDY